MKALSISLIAASIAVEWMTGRVAFWTFGEEAGQPRRSRGTPQPHPWLKVNGEAIYGTRTAGRPAQWTDGAKPEQKYGEYMVKYNLMEQVGQAPRNGNAVKKVFFTQKPDALYAITPGWPGKELVLRDVNVPVGATVTMLGVPGALQSKLDGTTLTITTPDLGPEEAPCRHAFVFKIAGATVRPE